MSALPSRRRLLRGLALAGACVGPCAVAFLAYGLGSPESAVLGPALIVQPVRPESPREVALTFDDGPSPYTGRVLDILRAHRVRATFFVCGANAERYPELLRRIKAEGHEIGNHSYSHPYLYLEGRARIADEIDRTQDAIQRITGERPRLFRPPFGVRWFSLWPLLRQRGMTMVLWSDWGRDGRKDSDDIAAATLARLRPGAIILLHDGEETRAPAEVDRAAMVRALPAIIRGARAVGYSFTRLSPGPDLVR